MFRILTTNNIHIPPLLPPHALTPIAQLLDRTADLHATRLYPRRSTAHSQPGESRAEVCEAGLWGAPETGAEQRVAGAGWGVDVRGLDA
jgi:hypothetical protein